MGVCLSPRRLFPSPPHTPGPVPRSPPIPSPPQIPPRRSYFVSAASNPPCFSPQPPHVAPASAHAALMRPKRRGPAHSTAWTPGRTSALPHPPRPGRGDPHQPHQIPRPAIRSPRAAVNPNAKATQTQMQTLSAYVSSMTYKPPAAPAPSTLARPRCLRCLLLAMHPPPSSHPRLPPLSFPAQRPQSLIHSPMTHPAAWQATPAAHVPPSPLFRAVP